MARINTVKSFRGTTKTKDGTKSCSKCGKKINKGDSYRWYAKRTPGSRSGYRVNVCMDCKIMPWENGTSSPHIASLMMGEHYASEAIYAVEANYEDPSAMADEMTQAAQVAAEYVREAAEGYGESADNIESGFGHETQQSEELREKSDTLESQADDLESWEVEYGSIPTREEFLDEDGEEDEDEYKAAVDALLEEMQQNAEEAVSTACEQY